MNLSRMRPKFTEDERQSIIQQPAKRRTETMGKQQILPTRSRRASRLSDKVLEQPARAAITVLLELNDGHTNLAQDSLSRDARMFLNRSREFRSLLQPTPTSTELVEYALGLSSMLMENYAKMIFYDLSYATRLKLAIIVWHFDDDPEHIRAFLRSPISKRVWESLYADYLNYSQQDVPYLTFIQSFDFLLSRQLPKRQATSEAKKCENYLPQALTAQRHHPTSVPQSQSTRLPSLSPRLDADVRIKLPPLRKVIEGLFPGPENAASRKPSSSTLGHDSTLQPISDFKKHPCTTNNKLTMNDQNTLRRLRQRKDANLEVKSKNQDSQL
ncbi:uncharacterized protein N7473_001722 [Penicillium subrubescens]|uniref:Uncharacterized protein n=1 Tax=Penicillium subrubescens TaxID=1316194 RepID=A0A1Q5UBB2_9EURO|nr:uncharacterized protein N7473_001722 [Penicillium subrubescens]KAJ5904806.1 hypothetical protein N7473_001722 [Penicillium subrubescens]OKP09751.1 hypothetical protein PENSUB_4857 [Penicillium subrubescens]